MSYLIIIGVFVVGLFCGNQMRRRPVYQFSKGISEDVINNATNMMSDVIFANSFAKFQVTDKSGKHYAVLVKRLPIFGADVVGESE